MTCEVRFRNEGTGTWERTSGPNYVELASCNEWAGIGNSFLNSPYDASLGWLNESVPCTFAEASVPPGATGTFYSYQSYPLYKECALATLSSIQPLFLRTDGVSLSSLCNKLLTP